MMIMSQEEKVLIEQYMTENDIYSVEYLIKMIERFKAFAIKTQNEINDIDSFGDLD